MFYDPKWITCPDCSGRGIKKCYHCQGSGNEYWEEEDEDGYLIKRVATCPKCNGSGYATCSCCLGKGVVIDRFY